MATMIKQPIMTLVILIASFIFTSCEESLPEYKPPENILVASILVPADQSTYPLRVLEDYRTFPPKVTYSGSSTLMIRIRVKNIYDEVLEDSAKVGGYVRIQDLNDEDNFVIQPIKYADVKPFPGKLGEIIRIRPNEQFDVDVECKYVNENGLHLWRNKDFIESPPGFVTYDTIPLKIKAYLRLYKKLGPVITNEIVINLKVTASVYYPG